MVAECLNKDHGNILQNNNLFPVTKDNNTYYL